MLSFDCNFEFNTTVETHGRDKDGAINNIRDFLNEEFIDTISESWYCGLDFDVEETDIEELYNGWFKLNLKWSGCWSINAKNESDAKESALEWLEKNSNMAYKCLENLSTKTRRFQFDSLENEKLTDILEF